MLAKSCIHSTIWRDLKKNRTKLNSYKPFNEVWRFYGDFVNPAFKSMAQQQLLVQYVCIRRISSCWKRPWKHTEYTKP